MSSRLDWLKITNLLTLNTATHNIAPMTEEKGISTITLKSFCPLVSSSSRQYIESLYVFVNGTVSQFNHRSFSVSPCRYLVAHKHSVYKSAASHLFENNISVMY